MGCVPFPKTFTLFRSVIVLLIDGLMHIKLNKTHLAAAAIIYCKTKKPTVETAGLTIACYMN
jgi:hypothetical protein